jgi:hypothetical protein
LEDWQMGNTSSLTNKQSLEQKIVAALIADDVKSDALAALLEETAIAATKGDETAKAVSRGNRGAERACSIATRRGRGELSHFCYC